MLSGQFVCFWVFDLALDEAFDSIPKCLIRANEHKRASLPSQNTLHLCQLNQNNCITCPMAYFSITEVTLGLTSAMLSELSSVPSASRIDFMRLLSYSSTSRSSEGRVLRLPNRFGSERFRTANPCEHLVINYRQKEQFQTPVPRLFE